MEPSVDLQLGIAPKAWAILHLLSGQDWDPILNLKTRTWYNGYHRGFALIATRVYGTGGFIVVFGESPSSESIVVESWATSPAPTEVTVQDRERLEEARPGAVVSETFHVTDAATMYIFHQIMKWAQS